MTHADFQLPGNQVILYQMFSFWSHLNANCVKQSYDFETGHFFDESGVSQNTLKVDHINSIWHTEIILSL